MRRNIKLSLAVVAAVTLVTSAANAAVVYNNNFDGTGSSTVLASTVGSQPLGFTMVSPTTGNVGGTSNPLAAGDFGAVVVNSSSTHVTNLAGTGNGLRVYDAASASGSPREVALRSTVFSGSTLAVSMNFASNALTSTSGSNFLNITFGSNNHNPDAWNEAQFRLAIARNSGTTSTLQATNGNTIDVTPLAGGSTLAFPLQTSNLLKVFLNQSASSVNYLEGVTSRTLAARTYDVWLNGTLLTSTTSFGMVSGTGLVTTLGLGTGGGQTGADWVFDNIMVENVLPIPEPTSILGLLVIGSTLVLRRRSAI